MDRQTEMNLVWKRIADHPNGDELLKDLKLEIHNLSVTEILRGTTKETLLDMVERLIIMYELCL
jgi:ABC-type enterochelin transport system ATPase subunit